MVGHDVVQVAASNCKRSVDAVPRWGVPRIFEYFVVGWGPLARLKRQLKCQIISERDTRLVTVGISVHLRFDGRRGRVRRHHDRLTTEYRYFAQSLIVTVILDGTVVGSIDFFYQWVFLDSVLAGKLI